MFDPKKNSVIIAFGQETPEKDLEIIRGFYTGEIVKVTRYSVSDKMERMVQCTQDNLDIEGLVLAVIKHNIKIILFSTAGGLCVITGIVGKKPRIITTGRFKPAREGEQNYLVCHDTGNKWAIEDI